MYRLFQYEVNEQYQPFFGCSHLPNNGFALKSLYVTDLRKSANLNIIIKLIIRFSRVLRYQISTHYAASRDITTVCKKYVHYASLTCKSTMHSGSALTIFVKRKRRFMFR